MQLKLYDDAKAFRSDALAALLDNEVQNNLMISLSTDKKADSSSGWLFATVSGDDGGISLAALCTPPFDILLYETGNREDNQAVDMLARKLRAIGFAPPGVTAEASLAERFARAYLPDGAYGVHMSMVVMRLDISSAYAASPGHSRSLSADDMVFAPSWERAFSVECRTNVFSMREYVERLNSRLGKDRHFFWVDGAPVSQAVHGRDTPNGAVINGVYTPPSFRGRGYAASVVSDLSNRLLNQGKRFCCLVADADNPASRSLYRKLGYNEICAHKSIRFKKYK